MDISKTCFRVSLMNFHLGKTPSKEDARSVMIFCLKQRENLSSGFPFFGPPQRSNQPRITDGIIYSFTFKLPSPFGLCLLPQSLQTSQGGPPDSPILLALRYSDWDEICADLSESDWWRGFFVVPVVNLRGWESSDAETIFFKRPTSPCLEEPRTAVLQ